MVRPRKAPRPAKPASSNLYALALRALGPGDSKRVTAFLNWLKRPGGTCPLRGPQGRQIAENIMRESHLTGDRPFGRPETLQSFLRACACGPRKTISPPERVNDYEQSCKRFETNGTRIPTSHLTTTTLLRYLTSRRLVETLLGLMAGKKTRVEFKDGTITPEEAFSRLAMNWQTSKLTRRETLSVGNVVWATFDHSGPVQRDDPAFMADALALPLSPAARDPDAILFEMSYPIGSVGTLRFPTVADAGRIDVFRPAPEEPPDPARPATCTGWTCPRNGRPPQPEIVHRNKSLRVLSRPPRFVGRIS